MKNFKSLMSFLGDYIYSLVLELGLYMLSALILMVLAVKHFEVEISVPTLQFEESVMKFVLAILLLGVMILIGLLIRPNPDEKKDIKAIKHSPENLE